MDATWETVVGSLTPMVPGSGRRDKFNCCELFGPFGFRANIIRDDLTSLFALTLPDPRSLGYAWHSSPNSNEIGNPLFSLTDPTLQYSSSRDLQ